MTSLKKAIQIYKFHNEIDSEGPLRTSAIEKEIETYEEYDETFKAKKSSLKTISNSKAYKKVRKPILSDMNGPSCEICAPHKGCNKTFKKHGVKKKRKVKRETL